MRKIFCLFFLIVCSAGIMPAALTVYEVPDLDSYDCAPCIASNTDGDIMVFYRNDNIGAVYYFKKHDSSDWVGPKAIPGQAGHYDPSFNQMIFYTGLTATPNNKFHAIWAFDIHAGWSGGLYYAEFNPTTMDWTNPELTVTGKIERPHLITNPGNGDVLLAYDCYRYDNNKDVYLKIKTQNGNWREEINITNAKPANEANRIVTAPHGEAAETDANVAVDAQTGYIYYTYKQDFWDAIGEAWELRICVAMFNPQYKLLWKKEVTTDYWGYHFLPSIAAINNQVIMAFAWNQKMAYYYLTLQKDGNKLDYDKAILEDNRITSMPVKPHWEFFSQLFAYGDEILFTYKDPQFKVKMLRMNTRGEKLDTRTIDLCDNMESAWPYSCWLDPKIGVLSAWPTRDRMQVYFSIYDYPLIDIYSAVNVSAHTYMESSLFNKYYFNKITWENNPKNSEKNITVAKYNIYRKLKTQAKKDYALLTVIIGSTTTSYIDKPISSSTNPYDYAVTCVNEKGEESKID